MIQLCVQFAVIVIWSLMIGFQVRRLLRLSSAEVVARWGGRLRQRIGRMWWWLGREEFWLGVQSDVLRCLQMTLMVFLAAWGVLS
jgi:hypothetical protein